MFKYVIIFFDVRLTYVTVMGKILFRNCNLKIDLPQENYIIGISPQKVQIKNV